MHHGFLQTMAQRVCPSRPFRNSFSLCQTVTPRVGWYGPRLEFRVEVELPYKPGVERLPLSIRRLELNFEVTEECGHKLVDLKQTRRIC
jgi:hypothetical protein